MLSLSFFVTLNSFTHTLLHRNVGKKCQSKLRKISEEQISHVNQGISLKSREVLYLLASSGT